MKIDFMLLEAHKPNISAQILHICLSLSNKQQKQFLSLLRNKTSSTFSNNTKLTNKHYIR